jgi:hypothetical protein
MTKAREILTNDYNQAEKRLAALIEGRRLSKVILRHLRNVPISHIGISSTSWEGKAVQYSCTIYISRKVKSFRDLSSLLARLDALPQDSSPEYVDDERGWRSSDDKSEGVRRYTRDFYRRGVRFAITLTGIPESDDGTCRRVQVGTKTYTNTTTEPVYELVCD